MVVQIMPKKVLTSKSTPLQIVKALQKYFSVANWTTTQAGRDGKYCVGGAACKLAGLEPSDMYQDPPIINTLAQALPKNLSMEWDPHTRVYKWNDKFKSKEKMLESLAKIRAKLEKKA